MMGTEQFRLKWNNHTNHLVDVFGNLLQAESLVDVTLSCEGQSVKAHKLVLSACSSYFKALFQEHTEAHPIVILKDVKFAELRCIIEFMYKGEVDVEKNDLSSLFLTAESLMIKGLMSPGKPVGGVCRREPPPTPDYCVDRKRPRPGEPFDTGGDHGGDHGGGHGGDHGSGHGGEHGSGGGGGGGGGDGERGPPRSPPTGQQAPHYSNGDDSSVIKRPKLEPASGEENSTDGMETGGAAGTAYLCRDCGCSFQSQTQLQEHYAAAHGSAGTPPEPPPPPPPPPLPAGHGSGTVIRGPPGRGRPDDAPSAPPVHSHSWPPHDGRDQPLWGKLEGGIRLPPYLQPGVRADLPFLPPLVGLREMGPAPGMGGGILGMMPLIRGRHMTAGADLDGRGPLNLVVDGSGSPTASPSGEQSEPSTPTPAEDGAPVTCKVCTRTFESPAALREHASVHQGERPFRCEWCGKAFKFRHHLKDHCRIHTGERPFDCKLCGKTFARSSILKTHTKIHRQEERRLELASPFLAGGVPSLAELPAGLDERSAAAGGDRPLSLVERVTSLPDRPSLAALPTPPPLPTPPAPPAAPGAPPSAPSPPAVPAPQVVSAPPPAPGSPVLPAASSASGQPVVPAAPILVAEPAAEGSTAQ